MVDACNITVMVAYISAFTMLPGYSMKHRHTHSYYIITLRNVLHKGLWNQSVLYNNFRMGPCSAKCFSERCV